MSTECHNINCPKFNAPGEYSAGPFADCDGVCPTAKETNRALQPWRYKTTPGSNFTRCTIYEDGGHAIARHVLVEDAVEIVNAHNEQMWLGQAAYEEIFG